jgi:DNA-binding Lrp family transcriptional regulator
MNKAHVLVRLTPGLESSAVGQIRSIPGVVEIIMVFGRWDAIVQAEAKTLPSLSRLVINQIRGIQGVQATETLVTADL